MVKHRWHVWTGECAGSGACCVSVKAGHVFPLMGRSRVNKQSNCKPSHSPPPATCQQSHQPTRHVYMASTCTDINIHILLYYLSYKAKALDVLHTLNFLYEMWGQICACCSHEQNPTEHVQCTGLGWWESWQLTTVSANKSYVSTNDRLLVGSCHQLDNWEWHF